MRILQIAYECMTGKENFYKQIGENTTSLVLEAKSLLQKMLLTTTAI